MNISDEQAKQPNPAERSQADADLEREIRAERKFTLTEAIGRLAGPGSMKGASPITRTQQIISEIETWLRQHLADSQGALLTVLLQQIQASDLMQHPSQNPAGAPALKVLAEYCRRTLDSQYQMTELVRSADIEWGRAFDERPRLEKPGVAPDSDDPYTLESVRRELSGLLELLTL
jgi:hypothetical protein